MRRMGTLTCKIRVLNEIRRLIWEYLHFSGIHNHLCTEKRSNEKRMDRVELLAVWSGQLWKLGNRLYFVVAHDIAFSSDSAKLFTVFEWPGRAFGEMGSLRNASISHKWLFRSIYPFYMRKIWLMLDNRLSYSRCLEWCRAAKSFAQQYNKTQIRPVKISANSPSKRVNDIHLPRKLLYGKLCYSYVHTFLCIRNELVAQWRTHKHTNGHGISCRNFCCMIVYGSFSMFRVL